MQTSARASRTEPGLPVRATTFTPMARAASAALITLGLLPLVLMAISTSPARPWDSM
ncbi:hypothetical protein D3C84_1224610 [compost metagenome]